MEGERERACRNKLIALLSIHPIIGKEHSIWSARLSQTGRLYPDSGLSVAYISSRLLGHYDF